MEFCLNSQRSRFKCYFFTVSFAFLSTLSLGVFIYLLFILSRENYNISSVLLGFATALFLLTAAVLFMCECGRSYWVLSRKYLLNSNGIIIKYCNGRQTIISWEDIADICVCDVNHNYGGDFDIVIRISLKTEKYGPLCSQQKYSEYGYERWRHERYLISNYQKVICLDYSEQRLAQILAICKQRVVDRRTTTGKIYIPYWDHPEQKKR